MRLRGYLLRLSAWIPGRPLVTAFPPPKEIHPSRIPKNGEPRKLRFPGELRAAKNDVGAKETRGIPVGISRLRRVFRDSFALYSRRFRDFRVIWSQPPHRFRDNRIVIALFPLSLRVTTMIVAQFPRFLRFCTILSLRFSFYCRGSGDISLWFSLHYGEITPRR